jgi:hypothetical protein
MCQAHHFLSVPGLSHYDDVWVTAKKHPQTLTYDMMIIGNQHSNRH